MLQLNFDRFSFEICICSEEANISKPLLLGNFFAPNKQNYFPETKTTYSSYSLETGRNRETETKHLKPMIFKCCAMRTL